MATYRSWAQSGVTQRANSTAYSLGDRMQPLISDTSTNYAVARRYVWECTTAGTSGASVPAWSASYTVDSSTITDGTVTWTCRAPGYSSGSTVDWTFASIYVGYVSRLLADGDLLLVHYTSSETASGSVAPHIIAAGSARIVSVDKDAAEVYTKMGASGNLGNSTVTSSSQIGADTGKTLRARGLTFRHSGSGGSLQVAPIDDTTVELDDCELALTNSATTAAIRFGVNSNVRAKVILKNTVIRRAHASQALNFAGRLDWYGGSVAGAAVTTILATISNGAVSSTTGTVGVVVGVDFSAAASTATLVSDSGHLPASVSLTNCILPSSYAVLSGAGNLNESGLEVLLTNCKAGSESGINQYANALGSMKNNTTITHDGESYSWKIDANASASRAAPFRTPWIWGQVDTGASITPRFEILRNDSTSALTDAEVWCEQGAEVTASSPIKTFGSSEAAYSSSGSNIATGAGLTAWAGESGTAWSGKVDCGAITPTGDELMMRLCVATTTPVYLAQRPYW